MAAHYDLPFMLIAASGTTLLTTRAEVLAMLESNFDGLRKANYLRSTFPTLGTHMLSPDLAVISGHAIRHAIDGTEIASFGATYVWRRVESAWKMTVVTAHDPSGVLSLTAADPVV